MISGILGGVFPVLGTATFVCLGLGMILRANHALIQVFNWVVYPLQISLIIPFMKLGSFVWPGSGIDLTIGQVHAAFQTGWIEGIRIIGIAHLYGILGWCLIAIPLILIIKWRSLMFAGRAPRF